jgi:homoserine kinase
MFMQQNPSSQRIPEIYSVSPDGTTTINIVVVEPKFRASTKQVQQALWAALSSLQIRYSPAKIASLTYMFTKQKPVL